MELWKWKQRRNQPKPIRAANSGIRFLIQVHVLEKISTTRSHRHANARATVIFIKK